MERSFKDLYKQRLTCVKDQQQRRMLNLQRQQQERDTLIANFRSMLKPLEVEVDEETPTISHNKLMLFEWLADIPEDLTEKWLMMLHPKGQRCLLLAKNNRTRLFSSAGKCVKSFECSVFPGGSRYGNSFKNMTTLDCVYDEISNSLYVLDGMVWNGLYLIDCPAEMRIFFIQSRINDYFQLQSNQKFLNINQIQVIPRPCINLDADKISRYLLDHSNLPYKIEGVLFYHKDSFYYCGEGCALVGRLKISMLPLQLDICNIPTVLLNDEEDTSISGKDQLSLRQWLASENELLYSNK